MKNLIIIVAFSLLAASQAFADGAPSAALSLTSTGLSAYGGSSTSTCTTLIGKTSTGVGLGWNAGPQGYALTTQHKSGSRAFGTSFDSTSIYYLDVTSEQHRPPLTHLLSAPGNPCSDSARG